MLVTQRWKLRQLGAVRAQPCTWVLGEAGNWPTSFLRVYGLRRSRGP